ncbi:pantetheinase-like [Ptychodera flava]|uniref:pantetheinase-like n=1 Tax=Ptychodera flava TaxID=63121 RepID=UPI003969D30B
MIDIRLFLSLAVLAVLLMPHSVNAGRVAKYNQGSSSGTILAAVYEHFSFSYVLPAETLTRDVAMLVMDTNLDVFREQAEKAAKKGVKIIVFPEYGITGLGLSRDELLLFSESVPHPADFSVPIKPCEDNQGFNRTVLGKLSCMARDNSIALVANMATAYACTKSEDPNCPDDGRYQYNTNVAFLSDGSFAARYFKVNLFAGERHTFQFGHVRPRNFGVFETEFGLFGTFTCFDILFAQPASDLIDKIGVRYIAFPTAWMNVLPLLTAIEFQQAFAMSRGVNLLAANQHLPLAKMTGSGLYSSSQGAVAYHYDMNNYRGKLAIGRLPAGKSHDTTISENLSRLQLSTFDQSDRRASISQTWRRSIASSSVNRGNGPSFIQLSNSKTTSTKKSVNERKMRSHPAHKQTTRAPKYSNTAKITKTFTAVMNDDPYTFALVEKNAGKLEVCYNNLCCFLNYKKQQNSLSKDRYALGVFDGLHTTDGQYYLQVCALVKCESGPTGQCGQAVSHASTIFTYFHLTGNFTLTGVTKLFPEVLTSGIELASTAEWETTTPFNTIWSERGVSQPLLVAAIYGRRFDKDPTKIQRQD